jgi:hypothetical protein
MDTLIVIVIVLAAAAGVTWAFLRSARGKGGCAGCRGCALPEDETSADRPEEDRDGAG